MKTTFKVRDHQYEVTISKKARGEADKFQPYTATVSGQPGGAVNGTLQFTEDTIADADKKAAAGGPSLDDALSRASARALAAEVLIRKLKPDFSFIVDHRWLS